MVGLLIQSGVSQRRAAMILGVNRKTIVRKFRFGSRQAQRGQVQFLDTLVRKHHPSPPFARIQFDDLETSEHSKCKPLSVALAVDPESRKILAFQVSSMPARGHLARIARKKYGKRPDRRPEGWQKLFASLKPLVQPTAHFLSDENPHYPKHLRRAFPKGRHETTPGRRPRVAGLGELKKGGHDPLFALNHTCAMLRANLNRLFRRTWCTTKTQTGLEDHLHLYIHFHNQTLTPPLRI